MDILFVTGFLGSGKTTFLKRYLADRRKDVGVIINDFGPLSVDVHVVEELAEATAGVNGGSMFCVCKKDTFFRTLRDMAQKNLDEIIIETSGFSNPAEALTFLHEESLSDIGYRGVVAVVAADVFEKVVSTCVTAREQIRAADLLLVSKMDLTERTLSEVEKSIRKWNESAPVFRMDHGEHDETWLDLTRPTQGGGPSTMDLSLRSCLLKFDPLPSAHELEVLLEEIWPHVDRVKGVIERSEGTQFVEYDEGGIQCSPLKKGNGSFLSLMGRTPVMDKRNIAAICEKYPFVRMYE